jgi:hypothetical protein
LPEDVELQDFGMHEFFMQLIVSNGAIDERNVASAEVHTTANRALGEC